MKGQGSMRAFLSRHRAAVGVSAVVAVGLVVFVLVWFQPQKLFLDKTVDEPLMVADVELEPTPGQTPTAPPVKTLAEGSFQSLEHQTTGRALLLELSNGKRIIRFRNLDTSNGPDLRVYLSEIPADGDVHAYGERFVDLGALKGNLGNQNYAIPDGLDLSRYRSVVIWCRRFAVGFGVAAL
jgi:hypothetical protein